MSKPDPAFGRAMDRWIAERDYLIAELNAAEARAELAERKLARLEERLCTICGQPSGRAAECWACFVAGDDAYRRAVNR